jgi:hypothetical protein
VSLLSSAATAKRQAGYRSSVSEAEHKTGAGRMDEVAQ